MTRTRLNVWSPDAGEALRWYGLAVAEMQKLPISDPTSWRYQAAIHGYDPSQDPFADGNDNLPSGQDQERFWLQCQHSSWFFLPWHRMYLHFFERIVAAQVARLGGPADWALPYWNYSGDSMTRLLPSAFRDRALPNGERNALYVEARNPECNAGNPFADDRDADLRPSLGEPRFDGAPFGGSPGFGGPATAFNHGGGPVGTLEAVPHGTMHVAVNGFMGSFETAALDPIFWLHHANIDRLWDVWLRRSPSHKNPTNGGWLTEIAFELHDENGAVVSMRPRDVLDSSADPLAYVYDDVSDPFAPPDGVERLPTPEVPVTPKRPPEMVGATSAPVALEGATTHASVPVTAPTGPAAPAGALGLPQAGESKVYLNLENVTSDQRAQAYDVYVNVPKDADPSEHEHLHVGRMPLFGVAEASKAELRHSGSGLHYVFDITSLYGKLAGTAGFDPGNLRVSFVPAGKATPAKVSVGRISVYRQ